MIYIVMGSCGEYSDRNEWPVIAYSDEKKAKKHVVNATRRAEDLYEQYEKYYAIPDEANEFDRHMQVDYTGTSYFLYEVEFI